LEVERLGEGAGDVRRQAAGGFQDFDAGVRIRNGEFRIQKAEEKGSDSEHHILNSEF
jgi:hypothetical protein